MSLNEYELSDRFESSIPRRFENPTLIGRGTFSNVYRARDSQLDRDVVLKEILHQSGIGNEAKQKANFEIQCLAKLNHPGIIRLLDVCRTKSSTFLILPFCERGELDPKKLVSDNDYPMRLSIIDSLVNAVDYLHSVGMLHNDIKPSNLLADSRGSVFLCDFGEACTFDLANSKRMVGSLGYMAPECMANEVGPSIFTEIYSIGVTIYEVLSGQRAFSEDSHQLLSQVSARRVPALDSSVVSHNDWNALIQKATCFAATDRYSSVGELCDDLQRIRENKPVRHRKVGALETSRRWVIREPVTAMLGLVILLIVSLGTLSSAFAWINAARMTKESEINLNELKRMSQLAAEAKVKLDESISLATVETENTRKQEEESAHLVQQSTKLGEQLKTELARTNQLNAEMASSLALLDKSLLEQKQIEVKSTLLADAVTSKERELQSLEYWELIAAARSKISAEQFSEAIDALNRTKPQMRSLEYFRLRGLAEKGWKYPKPTELWSPPIGVDDVLAYAFAYSRGGKYIACCSRSELTIQTIATSGTTTFKLSPFKGKECSIRIQFNDEFTQLIIIRFDDAHCAIQFANNNSTGGWKIDGATTRIDGKFCGVTNFFRRHCYLCCIESSADESLAKLVNASTAKTEWKHSLPSLAGASRQRTSVSTELLTAKWLPPGHYLLSAEEDFLIVDDGTELKEYGVEFPPGDVTAIIHDLSRKASGQPDSSKLKVELPLTKGDDSFDYRDWQTMEDLSYIAVRFVRRTSNFEKPKGLPTVVRFDYGCENSAELSKYVAPLTSETSIQLLTDTFPRIQDKSTPEQQQALKKLVKSGATIGYNGKPTAQNVTQIKCGIPSTSDEKLKARLELLALDTDELLNCIAQFPTINRLHITNIKGITDVHVQKIARLTQLRDLNLYGSDVTNDGIISLAKELKGLEVLCVWTDEISRETISRLAELPNLQKLYISVMSVEIDDLLLLTSAKSLAVLYLRCKLTEEMQNRIRREIAKHIKIVFL